MGTPLDALMMVARDAVDKIQPGLEPEDDWIPVMLFSTKDRDDYSALDVSAGFREGSAVFCIAGPTFLRMAQATDAVLVATAWMTRGKAAKSGKAPSKSKDREECHKDAPPTLDDPLDGHGGDMGGRLMDAVRRGVGALEWEAE